MPCWPTWKMNARPPLRDFDPKPRIERTFVYVYTRPSGVEITSTVQATSAFNAKMQAALMMGCPLRRIRIEP